MVRVDFGGCVVRDAEGALLDVTVRARLMGRRKSLGNAVVVGDRVTLEGDPEQLLVAEVEPRRNAFSRRAAGNAPEEQVVASNLDQVVLVAAFVQPEFRAGLADRVLGQAEHCGIPARLVLNKADLAEPGIVETIAGAYRSAGYPVHVVSAKSGDGIAEVRAACRGLRSLLVGHSGVGKSTLLNALAPDGVQALEGHVNPKTGKGRHTTTGAWLLASDDGIELVDTPGVRAFGLWGIGSRDLAQAYVEFRPFLGGCRFGDCAHLKEPGCALREAAAAGKVSAQRFESYLKLRAELEEEEQGLRRSR